MEIHEDHGVEACQKKKRENQSIDEFDQFPIEENWRISGS